MSEIKQGTSTTDADTRWLMLIHQLPPKPPYLRIKVGRHLKRIGAIALKNSVYVLPNTTEALEDFQWLCQEIAQAGAEATLCRTAMLEGLTNHQVEALFNNERERAYAELAEALRALASKARRITFSRNPERRRDLDTELGKAEQAFQRIRSLDYFDAPGRLPVETALHEIRCLLRTEDDEHPSQSKTWDLAELKGKTWVTRTDVFVDRIASAWLIRRFIDPDARFRLVGADAPITRGQDIRFDMVEAEFTHEGDRCTFEVLLARLKIREPGLGVIAEIVHDIDLKDNRYDHDETAGVLAYLQGLCLDERSDEVRLELGGKYLDAMRAAFASRRDASAPIGTPKALSKRKKR